MYQDYGSKVFKFPFVSSRMSLLTTRKLFSLVNSFCSVCLCIMFILVHDLGFSFGGILACCVSARLWHSTIDREALSQRVICITFGQPFLQIKMVEEEDAICPQFMESIHSVFNKKDIVPLLFSFLNVDESKHPNVSPGVFRKTKALVGPDDAIPKPTFSPKVVQKVFYAFV